MLLLIDNYCFETRNTIFTLNSADVQQLLFMFMRLKVYKKYLLVNIIAKETKYFYTITKSGTYDFSVENYVSYVRIIQFCLFFTITLHYLPSFFLLLFMAIFLSLHCLYMLTYMEHLCF